MRTSAVPARLRLRSKLTTILIITLAWSFVSVVLFLQGYSALLAYILMSETVFRRLPDGALHWKPRQLGAVHLRGKHGVVPLYTA